MSDIGTVNGVNDEHERELKGWVERCARLEAERQDMWAFVWAFDLFRATRDGDYSAERMAERLSYFQAMDSAREKVERWAPEKRSEEPIGDRDLGALVAEAHNGGVDYFEEQGLAFRTALASKGLRIVRVAGAA